MKSTYKALAAVSLATTLAGCGTVPITGRRSLNMVSDETLLQMSKQEYSSFVSQARSSGAIVSDSRIMQISQNLINATQTYLGTNNYTDLYKQMQWEVNIIKSRDINAFCMPGGKIVVYTGLADMIGTGLGSDDEIAAVIGHEIAHAVARHANERVSRAQLQSMGGELLGSILGGSNTLAGSIVGQLYGLGSQAALALPFNRKQELEADKMGMVLMAIAGYNPQYAVSLWQKMERNSSGASNSFWSTHPSEAKRIQVIQEYMPEAMKYYNQALKVYQERSPLPTTGSKAKTSTTKSKQRTIKL